MFSQVKGKNSAACSSSFTRITREEKHISKIPLVPMQKRSNQNVFKAQREDISVNKHGWKPQL